MTSSAKDFAMYKPAVFAIVLATSAAATAQTPGSPFHRIEVILNGSSCSDVPDEIYIVINAGEGHEYTLTKAGKNTWAGDVGTWLPESFGIARWGAKNAAGGVTECLPGHGFERTNVLRFTFGRCYRGQEVTFTTAPRALPSRYVREQEPCKETVRFRGSETARFVGFDAEDVRLQFGSTDRGRGLLVNTLVEKKRFVVTRPWVVQALAAQHNRGDGARSNLSPNALDLDDKNLAAIGFESVTIGVH
jgi:hypothetical protein